LDLEKLSLDHFFGCILETQTVLQLVEVLFWSFRRIKHFIYNTFTHFGLSNVALFYVFRIFVVCCLRLALSSGNSKSFLMRKVSSQTKRGSAVERDGNIWREWDGRRASDRDRAKRCPEGARVRAVSMLPANLIIRLAASLSFYGSNTLIKKLSFLF